MYAISISCIIYMYKDNGAKLVQFYETLWPQQNLLVHKDGALFEDKSHLKLEASGYSTHHSVSADQIWSS